MSPWLFLINMIGWVIVAAVAIAVTVVAVIGGLAVHASFEEWWVARVRARRATMSTAIMSSADDE